VATGTKLERFVELIEYHDPWPVKGTRAERRARGVVALWFVVAAAGARSRFNRGCFIWMAVAGTRRPGGRSSGTA